MKDLRLLPLVMLAAGALFVLRVATLALGDAPEFGVATATAQELDPGTAAEETEAAAVPAPAPEEKAASELEALGEIFPEQAPSIDAIGRSLTERRATLEEREAELRTQEQLLEATRQRVEERIGELEAIEARIEGMFARQAEEEEARVAGLVEMYAKMRAKDAARILDGLAPEVLEQVASRIPPRQMSEILAKMDPAVAQRLTVALMTPADTPSTDTAAEGELPRIVGAPPGN